MARTLGVLDVDGLALEITALLGAEAKITPSPLEHCPAESLGAALLDPLVAVVLEQSDGALGGRAAVEIDPQLAAQIVDRAFGGDGGADVPVPIAPLSDAERGALSYVAARLVAASDMPFVVRGVVTAPAALAGVLGDDGAAVLPAKIRLGEDVGLARLWLPERALSNASLAENTRSASLLLNVPLEIVLDASWGRISQADLAELRVGDAVILEESWLSPAGDAFVGEVRGRIAGASRMELRCALEDDAVRVHAIDVDSSPGSMKGKNMGTDTERKTADRATERAGDAPLEISVEIARFTMPLREVGALAPGEVLATGRALGERVTLRVSEKAIATGELVDVDGEVGVRVLSIAD